MHKICFVFGTRPEAIKLCPLVNYLRAHGGALDVRVCVTAQHRQMLDQVLAVFGVVPDYDLDLMQPGQSLAQSTSRILAGLEPVLASSTPGPGHRPGRHHVHALRRARRLLPAHSRRPRRSRAAHPRPAPALPRRDEPRAHLARSPRCTLRRPKAPREISAREGVAADTHRRHRQHRHRRRPHVRDGLEKGRLQGRDWSRLDPSKKLILVTAHRRESFGAGFERICQALRELAAASRCPTGLPGPPESERPGSGEPASRATHPNVLLIEPLDYVPFVDLMRRAYLIAHRFRAASRKKRPRSASPCWCCARKRNGRRRWKPAPCAWSEPMPAASSPKPANLLDHPEIHRSMARVHNPYGDGRASERIHDVIRSFFTQN